LVINLIVCFHKALYSRSFVICGLLSFFEIILLGLQKTIQRPQKFGLWNKNGRIVCKSSMGTDNILFYQVMHFKIPCFIHLCVMVFMNGVFN